MDNLTKEQRRKNMQNIRSFGTVPERIIARELRRRKIYFTQYPKNILGRPDFVFRRKKTVVFVDSDFWHKHRKRFIMPKSNRKYWIPKINRNVERDKQVNRRLRKEGWSVLRIWEYDVKHNTDKCVRKIMRKLQEK